MLWQSFFFKGFIIGVHRHNRDAQRYRDTRGYTGLKAFFWSGLLGIKDV